MNIKRVLLGTVAYTVSTFILAVVWHVGLFEERYRAFGYIEGEPSFSLGFLTILLQGFALSVLFPLVKFYGIPIMRGVKFALFVGAFFWTSHVLAFVAKQSVQHVLQFMVMETIYLTLQFGIFGILLGLIYHEGKVPLPFHTQ